MVPKKKAKKQVIKKKKKKKNKKKKKKKRLHKASKTGLKTWLDNFPINSCKELKLRLTSS